MTDRTSTDQRSGATSSASIGSSHAFDEIEQKLRDLHRSLGMDVPPEPVAVPVVAAERVEQDSPAPVAVETPEPAPAPAPKTQPRPLPQPRSRSFPVRSRRGIGPDLVLLSAAWAGLIVLVVVALGQAS